MEKVILVTGANKGIGFEIVNQLSKKGHKVILTSRDRKRGTQAVNRLAEEGLNVHFQQMDVINIEQVEATAKEVKTLFGKVDVLINNAGIMAKGDISMPDTDLSVWQQTMDINVNGPLIVSKTFIPIMPNGGRIINMSSGGGSMTDSVGGWSPSYCVSKSSLNALTRHMAYYLQNNGITVNAMCPGWVNTDMGGSSAPRTVYQGADTAVWLATKEDISTGKFWRDRKEIPW